MEKQQSIADIEYALRLGRKRAKLLRAENRLISEGLIGPEDTDCFALQRHRFENRPLDHLAAPAVYIVTKGEGRLFGPDGYARALKKGDYFFLPACASGLYGVMGERPWSFWNAFPRQSHERARNAYGNLLLRRNTAFSLMGHPYNRALLMRAWRKLLFNQFHDILAGCCIKEACEDAVESFGESLAIAAELGNDALQKITWNVDTSGGRPPVLSKEADWMLWERENRGVPVVIFNPHSFWVQAPIRINKEIAGATVSGTQKSRLRNAIDWQSLAFTPATRQDPDALRRCSHGHFQSQPRLAHLKPITKPSAARV